MYIVHCTIKYTQGLKTTKTQNNNNNIQSIDIFEKYYQNGLYSLVQ